MDVPPNHPDQKTSIEKLDIWEEFVGTLQAVENSARGTILRFETTIQVELSHIDEADFKDYLGTTVSIIDVGPEYRLRASDGETRSIPKNGGEDEYSPCR